MILDMSKIESGKFAVEEAPFTLSSLLDDLRYLLQPQAEAAGITYSSNMLVQEGAILIGDRQRIKQILINLVGNSIKFTERGGVSVTTERVEGKVLQFSVADTGIGIKQENIDKLFKRFEQEDGSISRRFGGTGLGLYISRNLAELLGGDLAVTSEYGVGSTFVLQLPYRPVEGVVVEGEQAAPVEIAEQSLSGHILVAEDTPAMQMLIQRILQKYGLKVTTVGNGQEAVDKVFDEWFDLILMDMQMPVMDGVEACKVIRKKGKQIPVIALTANVMTQHRQKFMAAGCDDFISKPIDREKLISAIARHLPLA